MTAFRAFVDLVRSRRPTLSGSLAHVRPLAFEAGRVVLGCESGFDASVLGAPDTIRFLEGLAGEHLGAATTLSVERVERGERAPSDATVPQTLDEIAVGEQNARRAEKARIARSRPAVRALREELGAEIAKVRVLDDP
jgi:hypothetical protein